MIRNTGRNIWTINSKFFCPITGYCLSESEQNDILKKYKKIHGKSLKIFSNIEKHHILIEYLHYENPISKKIQYLLNNKYSNEISSIKDLSEDKDCILNSLLAPENFGAFIWICAAYMDIDREEEEKIYSDIHMYTQKIYFDLLQYKQKNLMLIENNDKIKEKYKELKSIFKAQKKEINILNTENFQLRSKIENSDLNHSKNLDNDHHKEFEDLIKEKNKVIKRLKETNNRYKSLLEAQKESQNRLKSEYEDIIKLFDIQCTQCPNYDDKNLCQKRVLIVGGMSKIMEYYRDMVLKLKGEFYYHEGYCNSIQSRSRLTCLISKSDIIICPIDINSHAACLHVKKECKKADKRYYMLKNSSLSCVYNTLISNFH